MIPTILEPGIPLGCENHRNREGTGIHDVEVDIERAINAIGRYMRTGL